jgi:hypothetical protein
MGINTTKLQLCPLINEQSIPGHLIDAWNWILSSSIHTLNYFPYAYKPKTKFNL